MVDREIIVSKISYVKQHLKRVKEAVSVPRERFLTEYQRQDVVLFNLQVSIQACIDIGNHIFSGFDEGVPATFSEIFSALAEKKIINKGLAEKLIKMVGFRNLIVHGYDKIDLKRVYQIATKDIADIQLYIKKITSSFL